MSLLDKARSVAKDAAGQAADLAGQAVDRVRDPETQDMAKQALASAGRQARDAAGAAKRGLTTVIERIEPGTLADLIIRATAIQEKTNDALRRKGSLYRISEVSISATIPPGINFAIGRMEDVGTDGVASVDLVDAASEDPVLALDGAADGSGGEGDEPDR
jgi:hypothetical protein